MLDAENKIKSYIRKIYKDNRDASLLLNSIISLIDEDNLTSKKKITPKTPKLKEKRRQLQFYTLLNTMLVTSKAVLCRKVNVMSHETHMTQYNHRVNQSKH